MNSFRRPSFQRLGFSSCVPVEFPAKTDTNPQGTNSTYNFYFQHQGATMNEILNYYGQRMRWWQNPPRWLSFAMLIISIFLWLGHYALDLFVKVTSQEFVDRIHLSFGISVLLGPPIAVIIVDIVIVIYARGLQRGLGFASIIIASVPLCFWIWVLFGKVM